MHLSILCPTTPSHAGYIGGKLGHLSGQNLRYTMTGECDRSTIHMPHVQRLNKESPRKSPSFRWGEDWDLTDWLAQSE